MNSPYINRFLQPDTIIPDLSNPQSWNRYSYVTNRPVNFNDPTGHAQSNDDQIQDNDGKCDSKDKACNNLVDRIKKKKTNIGGGKPQYSLTQENESLCGTVAPGGKCIESEYSKEDYKMFLQNMYKKATIESNWGAGLVVGGLVLGAVAAVAATPFIAASALVVGVLIAGALGIGVVGTLLWADGGSTSNLASQMSLEAGSDKTQVASYRDGLTPTIAVKGDSSNATPIPTWSVLGRMLVGDSIRARNMFGIGN